MKEQFYKPLGFLFLGLAILGVMLPVLPATPFILLSAWFFSRSSEKWHQWLLDSELFGPMIRNWETNRCVAARTKAFAIVAMAFAGSASIFLVLEDIRLRTFTALMLMIGTITILSLKTCPKDLDEK